MLSLSLPFLFFFFFLYFFLYFFLCFFLCFFLYLYFVFFLCFFCVFGGGAAAAAGRCGVHCQQRTHRWLWLGARSTGAVAGPSQQITANNLREDKKLARNKDNICIYHISIYKHIFNQFQSLLLWTCFQVWRKTNSEQPELAAFAQAWNIWWIEVHTQTDWDSSYLQVYPCNIDSSKVRSVQDTGVVDLSAGFNRGLHREHATAVRQNVICNDFTFLNLFIGSSDFLFFRTHFWVDI